MAGAVAYALQCDVLIAASTGNDGAAVDYPANVPGVLAVGAVDRSRRVWSDSNHGPEVALTAPGVDIVSAGAYGGSQYCLSSGTSYATAYGSAAALVRVTLPNLTVGQVANRLVKSAAKPEAVAKLPDQCCGYGLLRPYEALTADISAGPAQGPSAVPDGAGPSAGSERAVSSGSPVAAPELKQWSGSNLPVPLANSAAR